MIAMVHHFLKPEEIRSIVRDHLHRYGIDEEVADRIGFILSHNYNPDSLVFWLQEVGINEGTALVLSLLVTDRLMAEARRKAVLYHAYASVMSQPTPPPPEKMTTPGVSETPPQPTGRTDHGGPTNREDLASKILKEIKRLKKKILAYEKEAVDREARKAFREILDMLREEHEALMSLLRSRLQAPGPCEGYKEEAFKFLCITARGAVDLIREKRLRSAIKDLARLRTAVKDLAGVIQVLVGEELG